MNPARAGGVAGLVVLTAVIVWLTWPRPDTVIRVHRGGIAEVTNGYGRSAPLGDTIFVGGSGPRRTIRVVNDDTVGHQLAMFNVPAGGSSEYRVPPGTFGGMCSAHPTKNELTFVIK